VITRRPCGTPALHLVRCETRQACSLRWVYMASSMVTSQRPIPSLPESNPKPPRIGHRDMAAARVRDSNRTSQVLTRSRGKPILAMSLRTAQKGITRAGLFVLIGHEADRVREAVFGPGLNFMLQAAQRGTCTRSWWRANRFLEVAWAIRQYK